MWRRVKVFNVLSQNWFHSVCGADHPDLLVCCSCLCLRSWSRSWSCRPFRGSGYGADPKTVGFKQSRKLWNPAVDVPVSVQLQFQQSMSYENLEEPQIQFIVRVRTFLLCSRDGYSQCKLCRKPQRFHRCSRSSWLTLQ